MHFIVCNECKFNISNGFECLNNNLICSEDIEQLYEKNLFDLSVFEYKHSSGILEAIYDIINGIHPANNTHYHEFNKGAKNKQLSENRVPKGSSLVIYKNFRTLSWRRILVVCFG